MRVKLHDDVEGHKSGETVDVPDERAKWLVANGYASTAADADGVHATSVPAKDDPTLAENREPANESLDVQSARGDFKWDESKVEEDPVRPSERPGNTHPEITNGEGDPEKGAKGKEALEKAAAQTDPAEATENGGELFAKNRKANDRAEKRTVALEEKKADDEQKPAVTDVTTAKPTEKSTPVEPNDDPSKDKQS